MLKLEKIKQTNIFKNRKEPINIDYLQYKQDLINKRQRFLDNEAKKLGATNIKHGEVKKYNTIQELIKNPPNMVLAKALGNGAIATDKEEVIIKKGDILCLTYSTYINTFCNKMTGKRHLDPYKKKFKQFFKRYYGQNLNHKKLFIWRTGGIGDILFSQPLVKKIKELYPKCFIRYATSPAIISLLRCWPKNLINQIYTMPFKKDNLIWADYHLSFEGAIERCHEAKYINCYDVFGKVANIEYDPKEYPLELIPDKKFVDKIKKYIPDNVILIQMRSSSAIRSMKPSIWADIIKILETHNFKVGIIDSLRFSYLYKDFIKRYNVPNLINFSKLSDKLSDGIAIASLCKGFIGIDSSFTHICAALNKPTFGIFGPFTGNIRMKYYKTGDWIDTEGYTECGMYPCYFHQEELHKCPNIQKKEPPGCLSTINPEVVVDKFLRLLNRV